MKKILIIGAASAIAHETAKNFALRDAELFLADLKIGRLETVRDDINARFKGVKIHLREFDALNYDQHETIIQEAHTAMVGIDAVLIAHGTLPDQKKTETDINELIKHFNINGLSVISLATVAAKYFENKGAGTIAVISSVAGDRGRQSNYTYGAAKGAVSIFLQGLRNRLTPKGVKVVTIKPGMVDTPMTADIKKNFLFAKASDVGTSIYKAMTEGKDVAYVPGYWKFVMFGIRSIPESIFKKMKL